MHLGTKRKSVKSIKQGQASHNLGLPLRAGAIAGKLDETFIDNEKVCDVLHEQIIAMLMLMDDWRIDDAKKAIAVLVKKKYFTKSNEWLIATTKWLDRYD